MEPVLANDGRLFQFFCVAARQSEAPHELSMRLHIRPRVTIRSPMVALFSSDRSAYGHTYAITTPPIPSPTPWTHGIHRVGRFGYSRLGGLHQRPGTPTGGGLGPLNPLEPACVPEEDTHIRRNAPPPSPTRPRPRPKPTSTRPTTPPTPTPTRPHPSSDIHTHLATSCNLHPHLRSLIFH